MSAVGQTERATVLGQLHKQVKRLAEAGMIKSWGRGIEKINHECRQHGIARPVFDYSLSGLMVTFRANPQHLARVGIAVSGPSPESRLGEKLGETRVETPVETLVKTPAKILAYLRENPTASLADTAAAVGKSVSAVERASAKLTQQGKLRFVGPRKGGRWEVLK